MKKIIYFITSFFLLIAPLLSLINPSSAHAATTCEIVGDQDGARINLTTDNKVINGLKIHAPEIGTKVYVYLVADSANNPINLVAVETVTKDGNIIVKGNFDKNGRGDGGGNEHNESFSGNEVKFYVTENEVFLTNSYQSVYDVEGKDLCQRDSKMQLPVTKATTTGGEYCNAIIPDDGTLKPGADILLKTEFLDTPTGNTFKGNADQKFDVSVTWPGGEKKWNSDSTGQGRPPQSADQLISGINIGPLNGDISYDVLVSRIGYGDLGEIRHGCSKGFGVNTSGGHVGCISDSECSKNNNGKDFCIPDTSGKNAGGNLHCDSYPGNEITNPCQPKLKDKEGNPRAIPDSCNTAIGRIGIKPESFARSILVLFLSLSGGILVIFFIINGYKLMTSQGDPKKIQEARESIISAIAGLLLIIFSLAILKLITVDILGLPGFS